MAESITISKAHLETLLHKAGFHDSNEFVKISVAQYNSLTQDSHQFRCLKAALVAGGASEATINVLIDSQNISHTPPYDACTRHDSASRLDWNEDTSSFISGARCYNLLKDEYLTENIYSGDKNSVTTPTVHDVGKNESYLQKSQLPKEYNGKRSLAISRLPDDATISDLTKVIMGGKISNIYIRHRERTAHVSFVAPEDAARFLSYSQQHKIIVKGSTVRVSWDERQAYVSDFLLNKVLYSGITRNLVIHSVPSEMTSESIREDLDHIFRLEVVNIWFDGGHAWIGLNSIQHAWTARTCMQSRLKYKKLRIEFFVDECDQPLPAYVKAQAPRYVEQKPAQVSVKNSFDALSIDSTVDSDDTEDDS